MEYLVQEYKSMPITPSLIKKQAKSISVIVLVFMVSTVGLVGILNTSPVRVAADYPSFLLQRVKDNCLKAASKKVESACNDRNAERALNVATYNCDPTNTARTVANCLEGKTIGYFNAAARAKPDSAAKFTAELNKVLDKANGSPNRPKDNDAFTEKSLSKSDCDPTKDALCGGACAKNDPPPECVSCRNTSCGNTAVDCERQNCDLIAKYLNPIIQIVTLSFGLVAAASLIYGGVLYASSEADPQKTAKAKDRIAKTLFAVVAYMFLYAFVQFLVPGGVF